MDQRKHPRIHVRGMSIDVSDGIGSCSGAVTDVSRGGLCLIDMALRFGNKIDRYTVVASNGDHHFKFQVKRCWERLGRWNKKIGVKIDDAPWQWTAYIMSLEDRRPA